MDEVRTSGAAGDRGLSLEEGEGKERDGD